ncbi:MAG: tail fiber domain-containing protein, partial [Bacteroidota bacterium]
MHTLRILIVLSLLLLASSLAWAQTTDPARLGVNMTAPQHTLDVNGAINIAPDSAYQINGTPVLRTQQGTFLGTPYTNLYLGPGAGQSNTTGRGNHFSGYQAGQNSTTGSQNYFSGYQAGQNNTDGFNNHFSGYQAGQNNTTGYENHFSGFSAGNRNTTGSENVYLGHRAGFFGNYTNAIAIGTRVSARGNNTVTIGDSRMTSIGGAVGWSQVSDGRFKREVAEDVPGLEFVTRLRPVSYQVDRAALHAFLQGEEAESENTFPEQPRETGFIAQEVEEVAQGLGYQFNGIIQPQSERDHYQLSYATFVVPLVQAAQEQQDLIEALQAENTRLSQENAHHRDYFKQLESRLQALESKSSSSPTEA